MEHLHGCVPPDDALGAYSLDGLVDYLLVGLYFRLNDR
jgi:hypothetical protein